MASEDTRTTPDWILSLIVIIGFVAVFLMGGSSNVGPARTWAISGISMVILVLAAVKSGAVRGNRYMTSGLVLVGMGFALAALQLVPLPPAVWIHLPGRQFVMDALAAEGLALGYMPVSLDVYATRAALVAMLPALSFFAAGCVLPTRDRAMFAVSVSALALFNVILGLAQHAKMLGGLWGGEGPLAMGVFINHNMYAAALYCSIPFLVALALPQLRAAMGRRLIVAVIAAAYLGIIIVGLAQSHSRAGFIFAILAVLAIVPLELVKRSEGEDPAVSTGRLAVWAVIGGLFLVAQFGLVTAARLAATDPLTDYRGTIATNSFTAFRAFFPAGSGFGTFVPVYKMFETPESIMPSYVNHAHNDWLEIAIEGGVPALVLFVLFSAWFGMAFLRVWRQGGNGAADLVPRAAAIAVLSLLLHSFADYPLRNPSLLALFAMGLGLMAGQPTPKRLKRRHNSAGSQKAFQEAPTKVRRQPPKFGSRAGTSRS